MRSSGPLDQVIKRKICNGCKWFKASMRSRGFRAGNTTDYWDCGHPSTLVNMTRRRENGDGFELRPSPKHIGHGAGVCVTPEWCTYLNKEKQA